MRLAILAALAAGALLAWLNVRDLIGLLRRPSEGASRPEQPDPMDAVQPSDPVTWRLHATSCLAPSCGFLADHGSPWCDEHEPRRSGAIERTLAMKLISDNLAPALDPDLPYLEALPLARMRRAYGGNPLANT